MTAPVQPAPTAPATPPAPPLRVVVVATPQPPLVPETGPVRLVLAGVAVPRPPHRPGPRPARRTATADDAEFGPMWSSRDDLPDPRAAGRRLLTVTLEALAGRRPLSQVRAMTSSGVYSALTEGRRPAWCREGTTPVLIGPVHLSEPLDGVAEISAVARRGGRAHAIAARLEGIDGRWRCTALQVG